jgi:hypothetical protein
MFRLTSSTHRSGAISQGQTEAFRTLKGKQIRCTSGSLWVTLEGDGNDYLLSSGQSLIIPRTGMAVISGEGSYQISPRPFLSQPSLAYSW